MTRRDELSCRDFVEIIMAWLDGDLEARSRELFDAHLAVCPDCVDYLDSYETTVALGKCICDPDDPDAPVPGDVPEALIRAVLAARRTR